MVKNHKYDPALAPQWNQNFFCNPVESTHAKDVAECPTYVDYLWRHSADSPTAFTDSYHQVINNSEYAVWN